MISLDNITGFEWDKGNLEKSYRKHGITPNEAEEVFLDKEILFLEDTKHSTQENRFWAIGKITNSKILMIAHTIRGDKIRIISTRLANKKERKLYEQKT